MGSYKQIPAVNYPDLCAFLDCQPLEGEYIESQPPALEPITLPPEQIEQIAIRLHRITTLFNPLSDPFMELHGIRRLLRGLSPSTGVRNEQFIDIMNEKK